MMQKNLKLLLLTAVALSGCQGVRSTLGIERSAPDEFAVTPSNMPLDMPPDFYALPVPKPGMARPQERSHAHRAREELTGSGVPAAGMTTGQMKLLEMAGAMEDADEVRYEVDRESHIERMDKPLVESLGLKKSKPKGKALNPKEEAERLQKEGVPTPKAPL